jgi:hypothetical protein
VIITASKLGARGLPVAGGGVVWWKFGLDALLEFLAFIGLGLGILIVLLTIGHGMSTPRH